MVTPALNKITYYKLFVNTSLICNIAPQNPSKIVYGGAPRQNRTSFRCPVFENNGWGGGIIKEMELNNSYCALRHGESRPNIRGVILSELRDGKKQKNTLTSNGKNQIIVTVQNVKR